MIRHAIIGVAIILALATIALAAINRTRPLPPIATTPAAPPIASDVAREVTADEHLRYRTWLARQNAADDERALADCVAQRGAESCNVKDD